ncbi:unnamed protein product [Lathyrus oleraceus]
MNRPPPATFFHLHVPTPTPFNLHVTTVTHSPADTLTTGETTPFHAFTVASTTQIPQFTKNSVANPSCAATQSILQRHPSIYYHRRCWSVFLRFIVTFSLLASSLFYSLHRFLGVLNVCEAC